MLPAIEDWLARIKRFWEERLDALERELRKLEDKRRNK
jgi:hypothetical protein